VSALEVVAAAVPKSWLRVLVHAVDFSACAELHYVGTFGSGLDLIHLYCTGMTSVCNLGAAVAHVSTKKFSNLWLGVLCTRALMNSNQAAPQRVDVGRWELFADQPEYSR
jgi:hypothetical protein